MKVIAQVPRGILLTMFGLTASLLGCSHRLGLHDPGRVVLTQQGRTIEIKPRHLVSIKWLAEGVVYSTQTRIDGKDTPAEVRIIAADEQYVCVKSEDWGSLEDIPRKYLKLKEVKITAGKKGRNPMVAIPLRQIREIGVYEAIKPPMLSRLSKKDAFTGALGGASVMMGMIASSSIAPESDQGDEILAVTAIAAGVGVVAYPAYKILNPRREQDLTASYPVDDREGWKIEISRE